MDVKKSDVIKLAIDLTKGKVIEKFSADQSNETLRRSFEELFQFSISGTGEIDRKTMRRYKTDIFEILEEIINETIHEGLENQFEKFAEYRNLAWGQKNLFKVPANNIFRVALISDGNSNLRRQRLRDGEEFSVSLDTYGIKIGEDFHRFLAGRVDWADLMAGIAESFRRDLTNRIYQAVMKSYGEYGATYHKTFTAGSLTEKDIVKMAMHIEARTGEKVAIFGTKLALRSLPVAYETDEYKNAINESGIYGKISGIPTVEIANNHEYGKDEFVIGDDFVLLLPQNPDKMVKVINEGDAVIQDQQEGQTSDMMKEYFIANRFGVSVITSKVFGFIKFS
jgi:hypothetical protein